MKPKTYITVFSVLTIFIMATFFLISPSYEKSIKAKYYYETGDYKEAYIQAKEAFGLDVYNRMAATIMAQSTISLKYVAYNKQAIKYMKSIDEIALHEEISEADKAKIRLICEIMIGTYTKLAPSIITDDELIQESFRYYDKFEKLLEKVNKH